MRLWPLWNGMGNNCTAHFHHTIMYFLFYDFPLHQEIMSCSFTCAPFQRNRQHWCGAIYNWTALERCALHWFARKRYKILQIWGRMSKRYTLTRSSSKTVLTRLISCIFWDGDARKELVVNSNMFKKLYTRNLSNEQFHEIPLHLI